MTLEHESYYQSLMASKGRSASICAAMSSNVNSNMEANEIGQSSRESFRHVSSSNNSSYSSPYHPNPNNSASNSYAPGASMKKKSNSAAAHRSQSARVVGSNKPRVKKRERGGLLDHQKHLDLALASSEGVLTSESGNYHESEGESYNPFLRKVPSTGKLRNSNSLEMSNHSLHGTPPPQGTQGHTPAHQQHQHGQHHHQHQGHQSTPPAQSSQGTPRSSPKMSRRLNERRGSDKSALLEKERKGSAIPIIATPEDSPLLTNRRPSANKPTGLPKSPQVTHRQTHPTNKSQSTHGPHNQSHSHTHANSNTNSSQRGPPSHTHNQPPPSFLDVPDLSGMGDDEDEESYRLRSFSVTPKGIINRGDSFRRRRSRSNSLIPSPSTTPEVPRNETLVSDDGLLLPSNVQPGQRSPCPSPKAPRASLPHIKHNTRSEHQRQLQRQHDQDRSSSEPAPNHRVALVGARGVGKASIVSQFMTSGDINAYDRQNDVEGEETVSVMLNGEEADLTFFKMNNPKTDLNRNNPPDAFLLVYSVVDRTTYQRVEAELRRLEEWDLIQTKAVVVVGNKIDLARSRAVSTQDGRCLAVSFRVKFIEVSVGINHNVDELLVGLLHQIRLKQAQTGIQDGWLKHRGIFRASVKARQMLTWVFGKEDAKFRNCENLHIL